MVDNYSKLGVIIRLIAAVFLFLVLIQQAAQFKERTTLQGLKYLLFVAVAALFAGNIFAIFVNFFRGTDGNLIDNARHIGTIFNSVATLLIAITLYLSYKYKGGDNVT